MNIFHKVSLQGLMKNKTRTFVTVIGVILSAALITGVTTFGISLLNYMANGAALKYGGWHAAYTDADAAFLQEQSTDSRVADIASFQNIGYALLEGGQNPDKPYLFIAGFNEKAFDTLPIELLTGRLPENSSEVIVSMSVSVNGGVKLSVGDTLNLSVGNRQAGERNLNQHDPYAGAEETLVPVTGKSYTVVGTYQRPPFEEMTAPGYTIITIADQAKLPDLTQPANLVESVDLTESMDSTEPTDSKDRYSVFVTLKNPFQLPRYTDEYPASFINDDVLRFIGLSSDKLFTTLLLAVGVIVVLIIMIGSIFLIYNAFHISLNERTHQFGILMSVGATEKQLLHAVLFEGLCIGTVGIPVGILAGLCGIGIVLRVVNERFTGILYDNVSLTLVLSAPAIAAAAVISLITILISAWLPAHKAVRTPVMECIRQTNEVRVETKMVRTSSLAMRFYGLEGTLALKNFKRNRGRYRSIVLSLVLSVVLFISVNAFVLDLKQASEMAVVFTTLDIALDASEMDDAQMLPLYDKLKGVDDVYESNYMDILTYSCMLKADEFTEEFQKIMDLPTSKAEEEMELTAQLMFLDDDTYLRKVEEAGLPAEEYTGENAKLIALAKIEDHRQRVLEVDEFADILTEDTVNAVIIPKKDKVRVSEPGQDITFTAVNIIFPDCVPNLDQNQVYEQTPYYLMIAAPYSQREKFHTEAASVYSRGMTFRSSKPSQSVRQMEHILSEEKVTANYTIWNMSKMMETNSNMIFVANVFAYTFTILISLIAVANVFNTISTNIQMRKRELAMLRSVGMSERDFQKMMNFECVFYGMRTLAVGIPVAILFSWLIYQGMTWGGADEIDFVLPWASMGISVVSVLFIVFITMLYATGKIKKENIIDALRDEMA